jgi:hypothetical protein
MIITGPYVNHTRRMGMVGVSYDNNEPPVLASVPDCCVWLCTRVKAIRLDQHIGCDVLWI